MKLYYNSNLKTRLLIFILMFYGYFQYNNDLIKF
jgi:hypothetical protein